MNADRRRFRLTWHVSRLARRYRRRVLALGLLVCSIPAGCTSEQSTTGPPARPNILWVVWDTARASNMSLYGHPRPTTPFLDRWAKGARVFDDAVSPAPTTIPSHASMFTGLYPVQHGANDGTPRLAESYDTIAEILSRAGYRTYLFSANPYLGTETSLAQGFSRVEHPWSPRWADEANRMIAEKTRRYPKKGSDETPKWAAYVRTGGELAAEGLQQWLSESPADRPFFALLNYMEAHSPLVPDERFRRLFMNDSQLVLSYDEPVLGAEVWTYVAGVSEISPQRIEAMQLTYDAAVAELDHLFEGLVDTLERRGMLENTLVVLTADHGELLGEHHLLNHQYSVHEPLLRVPLVLFHPTLIPPGREARPVMTLDLFSTLLRLAHVPNPNRSANSFDLLHPPEKRIRLSEYPAAAEKHIGLVRFVDPDFDPAPFYRSLRAFRAGSLKYIEASDGTNALYDLTADPNEENNLVSQKPDVALTLAAGMERFVSSLEGGKEARPPEEDDAVEFDEQTRRRLEALGY